MRTWPSPRTRLTSRAFRQRPEAAGVPHRIGLRFSDLKMERTPRSKCSANGRCPSGTEHSQTPLGDSQTMRAFLPSDWRYSTDTASSRHAVATGAGAASRDSNVTSKVEQTLFGIQLREADYKGVRAVRASTSPMHNLRKRAKVERSPAKIRSAAPVGCIPNRLHRREKRGLASAVLTDQKGKWCQARGLSLVEAAEIPQPDLPELTEAHDHPLSPRVRPKIYQPKRLHPLGPHRVELPNPRRLRVQVAVELSEARAPGGDIRLPLALLFLAELHD